MEQMKKLVLIDGHALVHRAFHALPPLTTKKGEKQEVGYYASHTSGYTHLK